MILETRRILIKFTVAISLLLTAYAAGVGFAGAAASPPVLDLNGEAPGTNYEAIFFEDDGPEAIVSATGLTIVNGDDVLTGAKAVLKERPDGNLESLAVVPGNTGLTWKYASDKGELTLTGPGSVADFQEVLRTLTYNNLSQSPDITDRVVEVTVSDGALTSEKAISSITVNAVNDAPVLDNSGDMTMDPINEDGQLANGNSVGGIIKKEADASGKDRITDVDKGSMEGFAVIEALSNNGIWQFSTNGGLDWKPFGDVKNESAVLLDGAARIRFVPNPNFNGSANFQFRAWDQSGGRVSGDTGVDTSVNGGTTPFSTATETVTLIINAVNDLPIVDLNGSLPDLDYTAQFFEGSAPVPIADPAATITDSDHPQLVKLTVTLTNRPDGSDESLAVDVSGTNITPTAYNPANGELVLNGPDSVPNFQTVLRRITYNNTTGNPKTAERVVTLVAHDGTENGPVATARISVNPTNNAPVLDSEAKFSPSPIAEDTALPAGEPISQILASGDDPITDPDDSAQEGIAIIGADLNNGEWQYSLANPPAGEPDWMPVGVVSTTNALLLSDASWLRFVPAADFNGESGAITFRAWDRTSGLNGQRVDASNNGGNTAFSVSTNRFVIQIQPVNDPPNLDLNGAVAGEDFETTFLINRGPILVVAQDMTLSDVDNMTIQSATVRITNLQNGQAEVLSADISGANDITRNYDSATGLLMLSGVDSVTNYQRVLRTVTYDNQLPSPNSTIRTIEFVINDGIGSSDPRRTLVSFAQIAQLDLFMPMISWPTVRNEEEPNNSCAQSFGLPLNESKTFLPNDRDDWFYFETTQSSVLTVELRDFAPKDGQIIVASEEKRDYGCNALQLIGNNGSSEPTKIVSLGQQPAGRYYIRVINDGAADPNNPAYRLYVRSVP